MRVSSVDGLHEGVNYVEGHIRIQCKIVSRADKVIKLGVNYSRIVVKFACDLPFFRILKVHVFGSVTKTRNEYICKSFSVV